MLSTDTITLETATAGAEIRYTLNGVDPTATSTLYSGPFKLSSSPVTIKAIALGNGMLASPVTTSGAFDVTLASPTITPDGGLIASTDTIALETTSAGAVIHYTLDGTDPTLLSDTYTGPFTLPSAGTVIKAIAVHGDMLDSPVVTSAGYTFKVPASSPTITPNGGLIASTDTIALETTTTGAEIRYTLNGVDPTATSTLYSGPFKLSSSPVTIKAIAVGDSMLDSPVTTSNEFTLATLPNPTFSLEAGTYVGKREVSLLSDVEGVTFYYTLDDSVPTETTGTSNNGTPIEIPISCTLQAIAAKSGYKTSEVESAAYSILSYGMQTGLAGTSGGYIFYDKGFHSDGWRYLEAASNTWSGGSEDPSTEWGASGYTVVAAGGAGGVASAREIGAGKSNTINIVNYHDNLGVTIEPEKESYYTHSTTYNQHNDGSVAAKACAEYAMENKEITYDDWFLPSGDELIAMYSNLHTSSLGGFADNFYWSSTDSFEDYAYIQGFGEKNANGLYDKVYHSRVRPVRAF